MAVKTYSIDDKVAEDFKENTPKQETSNVLEELMQDYLDSSPERNIQLDLKKTGLNDNQQRLLEEMIEDNFSSKSLQAVTNLSRSKNIYNDSKYVGEALKAMDKSDLIPYSTNDGKVYPEDVECECGSRVSFNVLVSNDCKCLGCENKIVQV